MAEVKQTLQNMVTGKEKVSYGLYFLGQNIFYMLIYMYLNTYYTDMKMIHQRFDVA